MYNGGFMKIPSVLTNPTIGVDFHKKYSDFLLEKAHVYYT